MRVAAVLLSILVVGSADVAASAAPRAATRADLARAFIRFEHAYRDHRPDGERLVEVNRSFDRKTLAFFRGGFGEVARAFDEMTASLLPPARDTLHRRVAESLRIEIEPPVHVTGRGVMPVLRVTAVYDVDRPRDASVDLILVARRDDGVVYRRRLSLPPGPTDRSIPLLPAGREFPTGTWRIGLALPGGTVVESGIWSVTSRPLDGLREDLERRLDGVRPPTDALRDAVEIARARLSLVRDRPDPRRTIALLTTPIPLARAVVAEVDEILSGHDPYAARPGHLWRTLAVGRIRVPLRVYVPEAARSGKALPLVIALHGAGADENVFPEAYGAGEIVRLAERHGFVLASPATTTFLASPRSVETLVRTLGLHVPIDESRVCVLGHSMGGMAATTLAQRDASRLAAVCAIAGAGRIRADGPMAPTLFLTGELDPIVPPARVVASFEAAKGADHAVELRRIERYGHTLIVGDHLHEVVGWLLARRCETLPETR